MKKILYLFVLVFSTSLNAQVNMNLGLKAYYPFSGSANDISGNNNNPVFNNATLIIDRFGSANSAYNFNGINSYIRIPNNPSINFTNTISLCAWVNVKGFYYGTCHTNSLIMKGDLDYLPGNYLLRFDESLYAPNGCTFPLTDTIHQNFRGVDVPYPPAPYTPYINKNQWYSVVYTYDGTTSRLYVDCVLRQTKVGPQSFTNAADLYFGRMNNVTYPYWFKGDMDEIRIYDRAINQDEVNTYGGCVTATNATPIGGVINNYTPVISFNPCDNKITVENAGSFNTGDTVMIMQMKGAIIDSSNSNLFGSVTDYRNSGNYEINYVKSKTGNIIELKNNLLRQYDIPIGKVQLIRVPFYDRSVTVTSPLTCLPWDGNKGGVLVLNVKDTVTLNADIDVSGKGFKGAISVNTIQPAYNCFENNFYYSQNGGDSASAKGEGITTVSLSRSLGKGKLANGGGSGNSHNSGGAGGSNGSPGGFGGYQWIGCGNAPFDNRGVGGTGLLYSNAANKVFLGGGGGAGHDNATFAGNGGSGGGIAMIISDYVINNGNNITANGANAPNCTLTAPLCHEGMGGGGAGGSVMLSSNNYVNNLNISTQGGIGGNMVDPTNGKLGPGGGGSGGVTWLKNNSLPANLVISNTGGASGVCTNYANDPWGATAGSAGINLLNLAIPITTVLFKPNIDSVRIKDSVLTCNSFDFKGFGFTNTNPISSWQWFFGDGGTANTQNTTHTYGSPGTFTIKLIATDINGCKDSVSRNIVFAGCAVVTNATPIGGVINSYTPVISFNPCDNKITVENAGSFNIGDTVMIMQMKGAIIDSSNSNLFGSITDYRNAGNYEINYVKSKTGNIIDLKNNITRQYDLPDGKVQLIRVPYYGNANVVTTLNCLPWDGSKGGVLVLYASDTVNLQANIDVSGRGFRGGVGFNSNSGSLGCNNNNFYYPQSSQAIAGQKGESIYANGTLRNYGKGSPANGGGAGQGHNSGGGGGSNGGAGGFGGYQLDACGGAPFDNRGIGGRAMTYSSALNRVFLGGGGGAGQADNPGNSIPAGGNGGGIIIIIADKMQTNGNKIISNGNSGATCSIPPSVDCHDGMGGGGGGGSVLLSVNQFIDSHNLETKGGKGADMVGSVPLGGRIGAGGGGGGGLLFIKSSAVPGNVINTTSGGANGVLTTDANNAWGSTPGQPGISLVNLVVPIDTILFKRNIDSVRIKDSILTCDSFDFKGLGYVNANPIASWQWSFGDGGNASTQNASHQYATGSYLVKLLVTDINGCKDSTTRPVTASNLVMDAGPSSSICTPNAVILQASSTGATQYSWTPAAYLNNPTILNPVATPPATTMFYLIATNAGGCTKKDSVLVTVKQGPNFAINPPLVICPDSTAQLLASGGDLYQWQPSASLNNASLANPLATITATTMYSVQITDTLCNVLTTLSTTVTVKSLPTIRANKTNDIDCSAPQSQLIASGGVQYVWSPSIGLNNPGTSSPIATPNTTTLYIVTGKDADGCVNADSITVNVLSTVNKGGYMMPTGFTPNNDGLNDCYRVKFWGPISEFEFSIYNRWGERIYFTRDPSGCWDGRYKGLLQDPGIFVYMIKAKTLCEPSVFRKGTFALIR